MCGCSPFTVLPRLIAGFWGTGRGRKMGKAGMEEKGTGRRAHKGQGGTGPHA